MSMDFCNSCGILLNPANGKCECKACYHSKILGLGGPDIDCICDYCCADAGTVQARHVADKWKDSQVDNVIRVKWEIAQAEMKKRLITEDDDVITKIKQAYNKENSHETYYIGGVDISFIKGDNLNACAAFVVVTFPQMEIVYEDYQMVKLTAPYIPGFLAFREADFIIQQYEKLKAVQPQYAPHVIFVDGNGILHPRGFGLASQLGVLLNVPCVGVAKTLIHVDGLENDDTHKGRKDILQKGGDTFPLQDSSGMVLGMALRSCDSTKNPIYVSVGHKISLESATWLVHKCCRYRIPEPTRQADLNSREYLRKNGYL
ncbi:endonuclease V-like [Gigantopelta aegis]|uniref:endonuclease V-like n=1 Tax=Gigantopelta aegis TaxID=1735272 RepID=UPI001B88AE61|nr:endonuclease V-like [Gigantopelta aegis]